MNRLRIWGATLTKVAGAMGRGFKRDALLVGQNFRRVVKASADLMGVPEKRPCRRCGMGVRWDEVGYHTSCWHQVRREEAEDRERRKLAAAVADELEARGRR